MKQACAPGAYRNTVLIVDDTPANLGLVVKALEGSDIRVIVAQDGAEGLQRSEFVQPDLILLDVMMPGWNGFEICRRLKARPNTRDIPVIFMTALADIKDKVTGFQAGGVDYVTKPLQIDEVMARVRTHLDLHAIRKQLAAQNLRLQQEIEERRQVEQALRKYREGLEQQVTERTAELRESERQLEESYAQLRELAAHRESVREDERKHIARELHDELGQLLTALRMQISLLRVQFSENNPQLATHIKSMTELVDRTIHVVRDVVATLRPAALDMGIESSLEWLAEEFVKQTGIPCELHVAVDEIALDENRAVAVFRIVQESLTNVARHAEASRVEISLRQQRDHYLLEVCDSGKGFDPAVRRKKSFGLVGVRERVHTLGGEITLSSALGQGTTVEVRIPIRKIS